MPSNLPLPNHKFNPVFPSRLFWDTNPDDIDFTLNAVWVIRRVFERGNMDDIMELLVYYGNDKVANVLCNTPGLKKRDMNLAIYMFQLKPDDFICFMENRFYPNS